MLQSFLRPAEKGRKKREREREGKKTANQSSGFERKRRTRRQTWRERESGRERKERKLVTVFHPTLTF
jgi:hypothetical protein